MMRTNEDIVWDFIRANQKKKEEKHGFMFELRFISSFQQVFS